MTMIDALVKYSSLSNTITVQGVMYIEWGFGFTTSTQRVICRMCPSALQTWGSIQRGSLHLTRDHFTTIRWRSPSMKPNQSITHFNYTMPHTEGSLQSEYSISVPNHTQAIALVPSLYQKRSLKHTVSYCFQKWFFFKDAKNYQN